MCSHNVEADALSRLLLGKTEQEVAEITEKLSEVRAELEHLDGTVITSDHIRRWTRVDPLLGPVSNYFHPGWPAEAGNVSELMIRPFWNRRNELWLADAC